MIHFGTIQLHTFASAGMVVMALLAVFVRSRAGSKPITVSSIVIPPIGMSTGFLMFALPFFRIPLAWAGSAFLAGLLLFSYPLIRSSRLERRSGGIYVKRSKSFALVLLILLALRLGLHEYIERFVSIPQTGALFFILAFGMIVPWRAAMLRQYIRLQARSEPKDTRN
ncbi:CcdC family protein [Paenibacillus validus]|uniref:CcdC family protein n=1 Tax=Paenibacillus validus TaxID=44253 RepID=UPI003D2CC11F